MADRARRPGENDGGDCPDPIELILYVSAHSPKSAAAISSIKLGLSRFAPSKIQLTIRDLSQDSDVGPTERSPGPRTFILGHITNPDLVMDLLETCGEEIN